MVVVRSCSDLVADPTLFAPQPPVCSKGDHDQQPAMCLVSAVDARPIAHVAGHAHVDDADALRGTRAECVGCPCTRLPRCWPRLLLQQTPLVAALERTCAATRGCSSWTPHTRADDELPLLLHSMHAMHAGHVQCTCTQGKCGQEREHLISGAIASSCVMSVAMTSTICRVACGPTGDSNALVRMRGHKTHNL